MLGGGKDGRLDLLVHCQTRPVRVADEQHLPVAGRAQIRVLWFAKMGGSEVVLEVVALKRSPARLVLPGEHQRAAPIRARKQTSSVNAGVCLGQGRSLNGRVGVGIWVLIEPISCTRLRHL